MCYSFFAKLHDYYDYDRWSRAKKMSQKPVQKMENMEINPAVIQQWKHPILQIEAFMTNFKKMYTIKDGLKNYERFNKVSSQQHSYCNTISVQLEYFLRNI